MSLSTTSPDEQIRDLLSGFWKTALLSSLARLGVADAMDTAPCEVSELASRLTVSADALHRLMRAGAAIGVFVHEGDGLFDLTPMGQLLRADTPGSVKGMAMHQGGDIYRAFGELSDVVATGAPPDWIRHGPDGFADLNEDSRAAAVFNQAMVDGSRAVAESACDAYDFGRYDAVMDVGGGYGAVLGVLLNRFSELRGQVFDLAHSADGARNYLEAQGVLARADIIVGSFFETIPAVAGCYLLKYIIHDWPDAEATRILAACADAARQSDGQVLLIERLVPEQIQARVADANLVRADLTMLLWNGRERTLAEYERLMETAGLALEEVVSLTDGYALLVANPA